MREPPERRRSRASSLQPGAGDADRGGHGAHRPRRDPDRAQAARSIARGFDAPAAVCASALDRPTLAAHEVAADDLPSIAGCASQRRRCVTRRDVGTRATPYAFDGVLRAPHARRPALGVARVGAQRPRTRPRSPIATTLRVGRSRAIRRAALPLDAHGAGAAADDADAAGYRVTSRGSPSETADITLFAELTDARRPHPAHHHDARVGVGTAAALGVTAARLAGRAHPSRHSSRRAALTMTARRRSRRRQP